MKQLALHRSALLAACVGSLVIGGCTSSDTNSPDEPNDVPAVINRGNHVEVLNEAFALFVGDVYNSNIKNLGFDFLTEYNPDPPPSTTACSNGGTALFAYVSPLQFNFEGCQVGTHVYDGEISQLQNILRNGIGVDTNGFSINMQPDITLSFSGDGRRLFSRTTADYVNVWWVEDWTLTNDDPENTLEIINASHSFRYGFDSTSQLNFIARMTGHLSWQSNLTNQNTVLATVLNDLTYPSTDGPADENWNFTQGTLELLADDGSALVLDADTGDEETVSITLLKSGQNESFVQPWSLWRTTLRFDDYFSPIDR